MPGILGKKLGMTQIFNDNGLVEPVTVIEAGPCLVVQRKQAKKDGYDAVQIGLRTSSLRAIRSRSISSLQTNTSMSQVQARARGFRV